MTKNEQTVDSVISEVEREWVAGMSESECQTWLSFPEETRKRFLRLAYKIVRGE